MNNVNTIQTDLGDLLILAADQHQKLLQDAVDLRAEVDLLSNLLSKTHQDLQVERALADHLADEINKAYEEGVLDAEAGLDRWENSAAAIVVSVHLQRREKEGS